MHSWFEPTMTNILTPSQVSQLDSFCFSNICKDLWGSKLLYLEVPALYHISSPTSDQHHLKGINLHRGVGFIQTRKSPFSSSRIYTEVDGITKLKRMVHIVRRCVDRLCNNEDKKTTGGFGSTTWTSLCVALPRLTASPCCWLLNVLKNYPHYCPLLCFWGS